MSPTKASWTNRNFSRSVCSHRREFAETLDDLRVAQGQIRSLAHIFIHIGQEPFPVGRGELWGIGLVVRFMEQFSGTLAHGPLVA